MDIVKDISVVVGTILSLITLATIFIKPIRKWIVSFIVSASANPEQDAERKKLVDDVVALADLMTSMQSTLHLLVEKNDKMSNGVMNGLRSIILERCDRAIDTGSLRSIDRMLLMDLYKSYHDLGGDTYCTDRYNQAMQLPEI